ncbi:MAG: decaprenyl-phosphate phosphoribosyltransferase [Nocardioides sp.]|nr:decaprenyl-phosphate phosphoribosyltransferase [Nocardioides sp.]
MSSHLLVASRTTTPVGSVSRGIGTFGLLSAVVRTARPRQWLKNALVLAAPAAGGVILVPTTATAAIWAAAVFTLASASTYFVNDARDVDADRRHPTKSRRPVAAGLLAPLAAHRIGLALAVVALAAAVPLGWPLVSVIATYLTLTFAYSTWLKNQPVLDILAVAAGFVLRAIAGAAATGVAPSSWFLLVSLFGSLFIVTAKRASEQAHAHEASTLRATLLAYPPGWLQQVLTVSVTGTLLAYATWAVQDIGADVSAPILALSVLPFLAIMLRYSLLVARGDGEAPETVITSDRFLLIALIVWAALVGGALYLA